MTKKTTGNPVGQARARFLTPENLASLVALEGDIYNTYKHIGSKKLGVTSPDHPEARTNTIGCRFPCLKSRF
jgi:hypothetical protein